MVQKIAEEFYNPETNTWQKTRIHSAHRSIARIVKTRACPVCGAQPTQLCRNLLFTVMSRTDENGKPRITPRSLKHGKSTRTTARLPSRATYRAYIHAARRKAPITKRTTK